MKNKSIRWIFWAMVAVFVIIILSMFVLVPILGRTTGDSPLRFSFFVAMPVFFVLGIALLVLTIRKQGPGLLKKFLLLTASSTVGLPVFVILHNAVSALFNIEEAVFFTLATAVCPLGFLVGAVGTIILGRKNTTKADQANAGDKP